MSTLLSLGTSCPITITTDTSTMSVKVLSLKTQDAFSTLLNPQKVIPTEYGLPRDWRGLAHLVGLKSEKIPVIACDTDPTAKVFKLWQKEEDVPCNIKRLKEILEELDRFDIVEDTEALIDNDIITYLERPSMEEPILNYSSSLHESTDRIILTVDDVLRLNQGLDIQYYDAFVVFAEEDINFATELIETLEKQYGMKLCVKERDLIAGIAFEHKAIVELIADRCNRLIVIVSPAFNKSNANQFVVNYAQALGIEQGKRKIIPCLYESCEVPQELRHYFMLDYSRSGKLWNFWEKLRDSIQSPTTEYPHHLKIGIPEEPVNHSENLSELKLKSSLVPTNKSQTKPKKDNVRFGSLNDLSVPDEEKPRLTASTNALYPSSSSTNDSECLAHSETKKAKHKNWFKKLLNHRDVNKKKTKESDQQKTSIVKEKRKIFPLKNKIKVPVLN